MEKEQLIPTLGEHQSNGNARRKPDSIPLPSLPSPPQSPAWRRGRLSRHVLGLGLLALGAWVLLPTFWGVTSTQATVNAPVVGIHAPIEGTVSSPSCRFDEIGIGQRVSAGQLLLRIDNDLFDE